MQKLSFENLIFEVTRRCNMTCAHCCKGETQNIDISREIIDAMLDRTELIGILEFFGGEPLLNVDAIQYCLDGIIQRRLPIYNLAIYTNGSIYDQRVTDLIIDYRDWINKSCDKLLAHPDHNPSRIMLAIAQDQYHVNQELCDKNFELYKSALDGIACVIHETLGARPRSCGRAANLPEATPTKLTSLAVQMMRLELFSKDQHPDGAACWGHRLVYPDQKIVCCPTYVTANGDIVHGIIGKGFSHELTDSAKICSVYDVDLWHEFLITNKYKTSCRECFDIMSQESNNNDLNTFKYFIEKYTQSK